MINFTRKPEYSSPDNINLTSTEMVRQLSDIVALSKIEDGFGGAGWSLSKIIFGLYAILAALVIVAV